jgi:hypothetical protein
LPQMSTKGRRKIPTSSLHRKRNPLPNPENNHDTLE